MKYFKPVDWKAEDKTQFAQAEEELRKDLIKNFVSSNRNKINEIKDALNANDIKLAHRLAHTLRGNAGQLKKTFLQKAAEDVENRLKNGKNELAPEQMIALEKELKTVIEEFEPLVNSITPAVQANEALDITAARSLLEELEPVLKDGNTECLTYIDRLRLVPGSEELIRQMEGFKFKPAIETLAELKGKL